jgi:tripartite-type tricarboxylate transporter receptor subunit TctC
MEMFNAAAGIDITQVTYRGAGPIITDLIGGQTQGTVATVAAIESFVSSGKVRALAVTGATRWEKMPEIPTIAESGYPGFQVDIGFATFVAAGTPRNIVLGLNAGIRDVLGQKEMRDKLADLGFSPVPGTPEELGMAVRREMEAVRSLIKTGRVKIDS